MFDFKHLSPFFVSDPAKVIIPGTKTNGKWQGLTEVTLSLLNSGTSSVFSEIQSGCGISLSDLFNKINIRNKLSQQDFSTKRWLVLSNAGGTNPCAAFIDLNTLDRNKLIIDQTLYWYLARTEDEAIFIVGILNSSTISKAISDFQPQGGFGARHIHTIPYKIIPRFNSDDDSHMEVIKKTKSLIKEWTEHCKTDNVQKYLSPNSGSLNSRRRKLQESIKTMPTYEEYEKACSSVLCVE